MKINNKLATKIGLTSGIVFALAFAPWLPAGVNAAEQMKPMKGGEHLVMLNALHSKKDLDALKTGDTFAMVCAKCKTVWTTRVKQGTKGAQVLKENGQPTEVIGTHACRGCHSTLTVVGHAKGDIIELKHSCSACGDDSAFCCATRSAAGTTPGMEKK